MNLVESQTKDNSMSKNGIVRKIITGTLKKSDAKGGLGFSGSPVARPAKHPLRYITQRAAPGGPMGAARFDAAQQELNAKKATLPFSKK